ncbi:UDP-phosphate galactose phosphotransferase [Desulfosarcina alkanivorans]|uniref:UDP-phosphate galactose phosphotransferase n=1 Tax=Desulfosarcina alkanivorans TaxID=571177 RepID=A0A5K7YJR1_9BACT|nr:sugar transferase [Desulfosarcina alkanivorans]BBO68390.1 UDP-phosphate galactose phosphotransferase [Desulfosarcina alkanivorans]
MLQQEVYIITTLLMALDGLCVIAAGYVAYYLRLVQGQWLWSMDISVFTVSVLIVMVVVNYTMGRLRLYSDQRPTGYLALYVAIFKALVPAFLMLVFVVFASHQEDYSRLFLLYFAGSCAVLIAGARTIVQVYFEKFAGRRFNRHRILVVGDREIGSYVIGLLETQLSWGHEIVGRLSIDPSREEGDDAIGALEELADIIKRHTVDEVVFAINGHRGITLSGYIATCKTLGVFVRILPSLWCADSGHFSIDICQKVPFLTIGNNNFNAAGMLYKRILDIAGGLVGTVLFVLMFPVVALAIKLDSPGPVIFSQRRVGQNGRTFKLYKFRSMVHDAEQCLAGLAGCNEMGGAMFKMKDDPRITRVGRFLRKTSLDEFPQFLNVLKGEMSLVGTRPPTPKEVAAYRDEHFKRISFKPGLTGLWQVSGRNKINDFDQVVHLDCSYMENWRFMDDLKILLKTVLVVLQRKGAI